MLMYVTTFCVIFNYVYIFYKLSYELMWMMPDIFTEYIYSTYLDIVFFSKHSGDFCTFSLHWKFSSF